LRSVVRANSSGSAGRGGGGGTPERRYVWCAPAAAPRQVFDVYYDDIAIGMKRLGPAK